MKSIEYEGGVIALEKCVMSQYEINRKNMLAEGQRPKISVF